jgi:hypothetical protein
MNTLSNIPQKVFNFFTETAEELAKESQFKRRESPITPTTFIKALQECCLSQQFGLELFQSALSRQGVVVSKQAVFQRFNEHTARFLKRLLSASFEHLKTEQLSSLRVLNQFTATNIIDSSTVSLHRALGTLFKGSGGAASIAAVKIQTMFDYAHGQIKDLELTSGCDNDQGFDMFLNDIEQGALYLMDLGYFKLRSFKKIMEGNAFFVSRLLTGTTLLTPEGRPVDLVSMLKNSPKKFSQPILMGAKAKIPVRLVAQRLPDNIAEQRRRRLKEDHRRRGTKPSAESLCLQAWSIYITNTTEAQISNEDIHHAYACRWQVELLFKLSKSLMRLDSLNTTKSWRVLIEIYGKFIAMMLLFFMCAPVRYQDNKELSFYKACKLFINQASAFIGALQSVYRLKQFLITFQQNLIHFAVKDIKKKPTREPGKSTEKGF